MRVVCWSLCAFAGFRNAIADAPIVKTSNGIVQGTRLPYNVDEFLGLKFATAKRFEPPVAFIGKYSKDPWIATDFGPACLQVGVSTDETYGSEDCLYANVWKPTNATKDSSLPVIVFIYGGSNQFGETEPYNGSAMASRHNVIYASVGYRTGPLGWMAFEEDNKAGRATGTWGMMDQQAGLRWVQREIRNFGGDPSRVIIHGQSSGATCVELHMVMPDSKGLIRGLVSESGGLYASDLQSGFKSSESLGKLLQCSPSVSLKACLQQIDPIKLTSQTYSFNWGPHTDQVIIPDDPLTLLRKGYINKVGVIMGATTNDSNKGLVDEDMTVADFKTRVKMSVGAKFFAEALQLYPPNQDDLVQNQHILGSMTSDQMLCDIRRRLSLVNRFSPGMAFMYRFNSWYRSNPKCTADPNWHDSTTGPRHEDEVTFVMGQPIFMFDGACCGKWGARLTKEPCPQTPSCVDCWDPSLGEGYHAYFNDKEWAFSQRVGGYWADLARYGTPNAPGMHDWPITAKGEVTKNIVLDSDLPQQHKQELTLYDNPKMCSFWDRVNDGVGLETSSLELVI